MPPLRTLPAIMAPTAINFNPLQPALVVLLPSRARPLILADLRRKHSFHELLVAQTLELFVLLMIFFLNLRQAFFCQLEFGIVEFLGGGYRVLSLLTISEIL